MADVCHGNTYVETVSEFLDDTYTKTGPNHGKHKFRCPDCSKLVDYLIQHIDLSWSDGKCEDCTKVSARGLESRMERARAPRRKRAPQARRGAGEAPAWVNPVKITVGSRICVRLAEHCDVGEAARRTEGPSEPASLGWRVVEHVFSQAYRPSVRPKVVPGGHAFTVAFAGLRTEVVARYEVKEVSQ